MPKKQKKLTPMRSIRAYCLGCSGGSYAEVNRCEMTECELFLYRMGKRPKVSNDTPPEEQS